MRIRMSLMHADVEVVHPGPHQRDDDAGQRPGDDDQRPRQAAPPEALVEQQRRAEPEQELQADDEDDPDHRVATARSRTPSCERADEIAEPTKRHVVRPYRTKSCRLIQIVCSTGKTMIASLDEQGRRQEGERQQVAARAGGG